MTKLSGERLEVARRSIRIAFAAYMDKVGYFQDRADCFEDALAVGLPISAALSDGGWTNVVAASRAYKRHRRPQPTALRDAYRASQRDRAPQRRHTRCGR